MRIEGSVKPGFEGLRKTFQRRMASSKEISAQLCIYVGEECVVDLWSSVTDDPNFGPDSLVNVFSSGKSLESIAIAMLVDRGLIDYDDAISKHWPEFAKESKHGITLADLMRHESGLANFTQSIDPEKLTPKALKKNSLGQIIENEKPWFTEGAENPREYHALTRGWVANELFRRVEPGGRTLGEFLREEISEPLEIDVFIGLKDDEIHRVAPVSVVPLSRQILSRFRPSIFGRDTEQNIFGLLQSFLRTSSTFSGQSRRRLPAPIVGMGKNLREIDMDIFNSKSYAEGEIPSAGAKCSARGLAKLASAMANQGRYKNLTFLSKGGHAAMHEGIESRRMSLLNTSFTQSGLAYFEGRSTFDDPWEKGLVEGREGFFGWMGFGGSIFQWHPRLKIGFSFVPTSLNWLDLVNERGKAYQRELLKCLR